MLAPQFCFAGSLLKLAAFWLKFSLLASRSIWTFALDLGMDDRLRPSPMVRPQRDPSRSCIHFSNDFPPWYCQWP